jgi:hypothetical protein
MFTHEECRRVQLAIGDLLARGLLAREEDPERASVRLDGRCYRYRPRFWTVTGILQADGPRWRVRLQGGDADRARRRVAEEWITAGAPASWARMEADSAVMLLLVRPETAARA